MDPSIQFDVIFIDGLHMAEQVGQDIQNALRYIKDSGFIVLHDCNPPTEYHAREDYYYRLSPARQYWNGTVWKAFYESRLNKAVSSCCIDCDFGVGVISRKRYFNSLDKDINPYFEFSVFKKYRKEILNLISFESFKKLLEKDAAIITPRS